MKHAKKRVVAIDYLRGIFILMVVIDHAGPFSSPYDYLVGYSNLWTSAAEMFLILSGITLVIVRGDVIMNNFKKTMLKIWRHAAFIYSLYVASAFGLILLALLMGSHQLTNYIPGGVPAGNSFEVLFNILTFKYLYGAASFLVVFPPYLLLAPFALYITRTRYWPLLLAGSLTLFVYNSSATVADESVGLGTLFAMWQLYFVLGLLIGRFRPTILSWFYGLKPTVSKLISEAILVCAAGAVTLSVLLNFNLYPTVSKLTTSGWLPLKAQHAYLHLLNHKPMFDELLMTVRIGVLRPLVALLCLAAIYILYQKYKNTLLNRTGRFINVMGSNTLWIFIGQAFAIPILAILPLQHGPIIDNTILTATLLALMWAVANRKSISMFLQSYFAELKIAFFEGKQSVLYSEEDSL